MALELRSGTYGNYYGDTKDSSHSLTELQMQLNATYIYGYLNAQGWTVNAIAGVLGNMQSESAINPGRWQSNDVGWLEGGYGLVQWTPATKYINWIGSENDYSTMDNNLSRIIYEVENGLQWISTEEYPMSFEEFIQSTDTPYNLGMAFLRNYERPADPDQPNRGTQANTWYQYLTGIEPPTPGPIISTKTKHFNFVLFSRKRRRRTHG